MYAIPAAKRRLNEQGKLVIYFHEWTIYEYLIHKVEEKTLRLKCIYQNSKIIRKDIWLKVDFIEPIYGTDFPDLKGLKFEKEKRNTSI